MATSGARALEILASTDVDVIVSDDVMPGMRGSELLQIVCDTYPHTIRMLFTGRAGPRAVIRAISQARVHRIIEKPCPAQRLHALIEEAWSQVPLNCPAWKPR